MLVCLLSILLMLHDCRAPRPGERSVDDTLPGYFGVYLSPGDQEITITELPADGPATNSGAKVGDVILRLDGIVIEGRDQLRAKIASLRPGTRVDLRIRRESKELTLTIRVGGRQPE
jgi:S1-C subfamily serine protease